jgi:DNA replication and repair protein RecF
VIAGANGHGKTALLEAIYFVATSRSFRAKKLDQLIRHGALTASVTARFTDQTPDVAPVARDHSAAIRAATTSVRLNDKRPPNLAAYATASPVVVFHAGELALSSGAAAFRRTLLDRLALFLDPTAGDHRSRYVHALQSRHRLLRGGPAPNAQAILAFEDLCAVHGAALTRIRGEAALALAAELLPAFQRIGAPDQTLTIRYAPGGTLDADSAREELRRTRGSDARRPVAGFGPHRDDLDLRLAGHPARLVASQGQHRALTLALKVAELAAIAAARRLHPVLLLDDISSELDAERTAALFASLARTEGQIFVTTTRPDLIQVAAAAPSRLHEIENGHLRATD